MIIPKLELLQAMLIEDDMTDIPYLENVCRTDLATSYLPVAIVRPGSAIIVCGTYQKV